MQAIKETGETESPDLVVRAFAHAEFRLEALIAGEDAAASV